MKLESLVIAEQDAAVSTSLGLAMNVLFGQKILEQTFLYIECYKNI